MSAINESRREFLKIAGYAAPVILTLSAMPAYAQSGSGFIDERVSENGVTELLHGNGDTEWVHGNNGLGNGIDPAPPGIAKQGLPQNDEFSVAPGEPDYKHGGPK